MHDDDVNFNPFHPPNLLAILIGVLAGILVGYLLTGGG